MDKVSLRQIISTLSKGGSLPDWISIDEIRSSIIALRNGESKRFTGENFISYAIEDSGILANVLYIRTNKEAVELLRLLQGEGDE